jgi:outer membrane protein OmpA-like peptidoglycan-associated protein
MRFPPQRLRRRAFWGISPALAVLALLASSGCSRYKPYAAADGETFVPSVPNPDQLGSGGDSEMLTADTGSPVLPPVSAETQPAEEPPAVNPLVPGEAAQLAVGREFEPVYFDQDSYELNFSTRRTIHEYAQWLGNNPHVWVTLEGHNDDSGSFEFGLNLAMARAWAVKDRLAGLGVTDARLFTISYGENLPAAPDTPTEPAPINRRVSFLAFVAPEGGLPAAPAQGPAAPPPAEPEGPPPSFELP